MLTLLAINALLTALDRIDRASCRVGWHAWGPSSTGKVTARTCATCRRREVLRRWTVTGESWERADA